MPRAAETMRMRMRRAGRPPQRAVGVVEGAMTPWSTDGLGRRDALKTDGVWYGGVVLGTIVGTGRADSDLTVDL